MQKIIDAHRILVGFNIKNYDNPILIQEKINLTYKRMIDLYTVIDNYQKLF